MPRLLTDEEKALKTVIEAKSRFPYSGKFKTQEEMLENQAITAYKAARQETAREIGEWLEKNKHAEMVGTVIFYIDKEEWLKFKSRYLTEGK